MGEKGNAADVAASATTTAIAVDPSILHAAAGTAVAGSAAVAVDVAEATKDNFVDIVADHVIDEGRDRLRKRRGDDENDASQEAGGSDAAPGVGDQAPE